MRIKVLLINGKRCKNSAAVAAFLDILKPLLTTPLDDPTMAALGFKDVRVGGGDAPAKLKNLGVALTVDPDGRLRKTTMWDADKTDCP